MGKIFDRFKAGQKLLFAHKLGEALGQAVVMAGIYTADPQTAYNAILDANKPSIEDLAELPSLSKTKQRQLRSKSLKGSKPKQSISKTKERTVKNHTTHRPPKSTTSKTKERTVKNHTTPRPPKSTTPTVTPSNKKGKPKVK